MTGTTRVDAETLYAWAARSAQALARRREEINALNVFPVPDADTGSNMTFTMEAALAEAAELEDPDLSQLSQALARGAIKGARGNSGVVLSQMLRAISQEFSAPEPSLASALQGAVELVTTAIAEPVEGTVISVLRGAAEAAQEPENQGEDLIGAIQAAVEGAKTALAQTPSQLAVLKEAGVVDAGGTGVVVLLETLHEQLTGEGDVDKHFEVETAHGTPGELEVMFTFFGDVDALQAEISPLGNSLTIARGDEFSTVHIHSVEAGRIIETAFNLGKVENLRLEILPEQQPETTSQRIIIALAPAGAVASLYEEVGVHVVCEADVENVLELMEKQRAHEVILLPNGFLDREQLREVTSATQGDITIIATTSLASGLAAVAMYEPTSPLATAAFAMSEAAQSMRVSLLKKAEHAALTPAGPCARGDILGFVRGEPSTISDSVDDAIIDAARHLLSTGGERVTVIAENASIENEELEEILGAEVLIFNGDGLATTGVLAEVGVE